MWPVFISSLPAASFPSFPPLRRFSCSNFLAVCVLQHRLTGSSLLPQGFRLRTATPPSCVCVYIFSYESIGMNYVHLAAL
jgi:hypothetical protein